MLSHNYAGGILVQFDSIHEYSFNEPRMHWHSGCCEDCLVVCQYIDGKHERIMINNVSREEIVRFAKEILEDSYNLELKKDVTNQNTPSRATATEGSN